jgi:hypothetical protein
LLCVASCRATQYAFGELFSVLSFLLKALQDWG